MGSNHSLSHRLADEADQTLQRLRQFGMLLGRERRTASNFDLPLRKRLWLWRRGFISEAGACFDLSEETSHQYLSNYDRAVKTIEINGEAGQILDDKLLFHGLLTPQFSAFVPDLYYYVSPEGTYPVDTSQSFSAAIESDSLTDPLVVKTRTGGGGKGVFMVSPEQVFEAFVDIDQRFEADGFLVSEFIDQATYAESIFPRSTNTIRILTMTDPENTEPFIARAVHRFGSENSAPLDNWSSGGVLGRIDRESGLLGKCAHRTGEGVIERDDNHPEMNVPIAGTAIPNWDRVVDGILSVARANPGVPYVGWDVVITDDPPYFKIIEANRYSGVVTLQSFEPLLDDPRVRRFYEHHDIL